MNYHRHAFDWDGVHRYQYCPICACYPDKLIGDDKMPRMYRKPTKPDHKPTKPEHKPTKPEHKAKRKGAKVVGKGRKLAEYLSDKEL